MVGITCPLEAEMRTAGSYSNDVISPIAAASELMFTIKKKKSILNLVKM